MSVPIELQMDVKIFAIDINLAYVDMVATPAMPISLIGFPRGKTAGGKLPIWVTGYIASEPIIDIDFFPMLYANASGEPGLSGAPVILRLFGNYSTNDGSFILSSSGCKDKFMGIYSGRICEDSKICNVWKPIVIEKILESINSQSLKMS